MKIINPEKLVTNLYNKTEYVINIRNLKQALNHSLILKKVYRLIRFNIEVQLNPYIDANTELKRAKNIFETFIKLMYNADFEQMMENVRKHRNIKLVTTERRRNYLVSESIYHTTKFFTERLLTTEMRKTHILMNKPVYLGLTIIDLSKTVMYEFWYDYVKPKYIW